MGVTGFQAACVMWGFIQEWRHIKGPAKLIEYENMLYPGCTDFDNKISKEIHEWLIEEAKKRLQEAEISKDERIAPSTKKYWEKIANGWAPFGLRIED